MHCSCMSFLSGLKAFSRANAAVGALSKKFMIDDTYLQFSKEFLAGVLEQYLGCVAQHIAHLWAMR